jgi:hypothetical protein
MKAKILGLLACIASIVSADPSNASSLVGTTSDASGINGLVVDGVTYDVKFFNSSFDSIYSSTAPTFLGNSGGAADAASALAAALTFFSVTQLVGIGPQDNALLVPFSDARTGVLPCGDCSGYNVSYVAFQSPYVNGMWGTNTSGSNDSVTYSCCDYVVFAPNNGVGNTPAVPEPSTWAMMILGFLGVGFLAYRRKNKTLGFADLNPYIRPHLQGRSLAA